MKPRERNEELSVATEEAGAVAEERVGRQNLQEAEARQDAEARARRYQEFFEFAPDGHLVTDVAGTIRQANQAIAEMLGVSPRFLIGKPLVSFVAEGDRQAFRTELNRIAESSPSTDWMLRLHQALAEQDASEALARVQRDAIARRMDPVHWAGFMTFEAHP